MKSKPMAVLIGFDEAHVDEKFYTPLIAAPGPISAAGKLGAWLMKRVPKAASWPALWVRLDGYDKAYLRFPLRNQHGYPLYVSAGIDAAAIVESFPAEGELNIRTPAEDFRMKIDVGINLILRVHLRRIKGEIQIGLEIPEEAEPEEPRDFVSLWMRPSRGERQTKARLDAPGDSDWDEGVICVAGFHDLEVAILPPGILEEAMGVLGELGISLAQPQR